MRNVVFGKRAQNARHSYRGLASKTLTNLRNISITWCPTSQTVKVWTSLGGRGETGLLHTTGQIFLRTGNTIGTSRVPSTSGKCSELCRKVLISCYCRLKLRPWGRNAYQNVFNQNHHVIHVLSNTVEIHMTIFYVFWKICLTLLFLSKCPWF